MTRGERGAANDITHLFRQNFFVANTVLNRTDRAGFAEQMSSLLSSGAGMRTFSGHDSEFAQWNLLWISGRMKARGEIGCSADAQATLVDGARVLLRNVVGMYFDIRETRQVCAENAADRAATDD